MHQTNLKSVALSVAEIIAIGLLGGVVNLQSRKKGRRGSGMVLFETALVTSYSNFSLSSRVSEIHVLPL